MELFVLRKEEGGIDISVWVRGEGGRVRVKGVRRASGGRRATNNEKTSHQRIPRRKTRHAPTDEFPMSSSLTFKGASWAVGGGGMALAEVG